MNLKEKIIEKYHSIDWSQSGHNVADVLIYLIKAWTLLCGYALFLPMLYIITHVGLWISEYIVPIFFIFNSHTPYNQGIHYNDNFMTHLPFILQGHHTWETIITAIIWLLIAFVTMFFAKFIFSFSKEEEPAPILCLVFTIPVTVVNIYVIYQLFFNGQNVVNFIHGYLSHIFIAVILFILFMMFIVVPISSMFSGGSSYSPSSYSSEGSSSSRSTSYESDPEPVTHTYETRIWRVRQLGKFVEVCCHEVTDGKEHAHGPSFKKMGTLITYSDKSVTIEDNGWVTTWGPHSEVIDRYKKY